MGSSPETYIDPINSDKLSPKNVELCVIMTQPPYRIHKEKIAKLLRTFQGPHLIFKEHLVDDLPRI